MDNAVEISELHKAFAGQGILKGVTLSAPRGKITTIIGGSGSGKSVMIKHLVGLLRPDAGSIVVDGQDITQLASKELRQVRGKFGLLFQHAALFDSMNVEENVGFPLRERTKLGGAEIRDRVADILERLNLPGIQKKYPSELSGGMKKRVGLARAIVLEPKFMIYDEPTTGLDPIMIRQVDDMIRDTQERFGVTSIIISHDMASTFRLSHNIAMLHEGRIRLEGPPSLFRNSADPEVEKFIYATQIDVGEEDEVKS